MPEITTNIELVKIQSNENYNVAIENENLDKIDAAVGERVIKEDGKGLSSEDYSTAEKNKLAGIEALVAGLYALKTHNHDLVYSPYVHNHDAVYLGKTAKASDSGKLNGQLAAYYAIATHNHSGVYEPVISTKKSGFNLDKSDSVTSTSSVILATLKAVKTAYDKAVSAYNLAADKLGATATAFNANKYKNREDIFHPDNYGKVINKSTSFTLSTADANAVIVLNSSSDQSVTIPNISVLAVGTQVTIMRCGSGKVTFVAGSGISILSLDNNRSISGMYANVTALKRNNTEWILVGALE